MADSQELERLFVFFMGNDDHLEKMYTQVVDRARSGTYTQFEVQRGLGITQMIRWFEETGEGWRAIEPLRKHVRFHVHNLLDSPPQSVEVIKPKRKPRWTEEAEES